MSKNNSSASNLSAEEKDFVNVDPPTFGGVTGSKWSLPKERGKRHSMTDDSKFKTTRDSNPGVEDSRESGSKSNYLFFFTSLHI